MFPLSAVLPYYETHCKFVLINCAQNGSDSHFAIDHLKGVLSVYGKEFISVHNILEQPTHLYDSMLTGEIHIGDPTSELLSDIIKREERDMDAYLESELINDHVPCHRNVFICGPPAFTTSISESLISEKVVSSADVVVLRHDSYLK
jgi:hypothetical protein